MALDHSALMLRALRLAEKGRGCTSPNPLVGAVVTARGRVVGEGFHARFGGEHAESAALRAAGRRARGGDLYVTLEPCAHFGKTPPCTNAVVAAGIGRVFVGVRDPNPLVRGRGIRALRAAGVRVSEGLLADEVRRQNDWYFKYMTRGTPFVTLKLGMSLDGRIANARGESKWITSALARSTARQLRRQSDAVLVGVGTVLRDDPRLRAPGRTPLRVVLDSSLRTPGRARVLGTDGRCLIFTRAGRRVARSALASRAAVQPVPADRHGELAWPAILRVLARRGIAQLLIEGGARVASSALRAGIVDRYAFFIAPRLVGAGRSFTDHLVIPRLKDAIRLHRWTVSSVGPDLLLVGE